MFNACVKFAFHVLNISVANQVSYIVILWPKANNVNYRFQKLTNNIIINIIHTKN